MKSESKRRPRNKGKDEYSLTSTRDLSEVLGEIGVPAISTGITGRIQFAKVGSPMLGGLVPLFLGAAWCNLGCLWRIRNDTIRGCWGFPMK